MGEAVKKNSFIEETNIMHKAPFEQIVTRGHELVTYFYSPNHKIKAIVAVHSSVLGPALGGCRVRNYENELEALEDVLRLSEGMTYKNSVAGLDLGGGKACIIADPLHIEQRAEFFQEFGRFVESLGGKYITAEDMGTCVEDIMNIKKTTKYVSGTERKDGGAGDPSPFTALGVYLSMQAAAERLFGSKDLKGKKISVQGVGHTGSYLIKHLVDAGAKVVATDVNEIALKQMKDEYPIEVVQPEAIYDVDCDIYSPCAIGQTVNSSTIPRLKCKAIVGSANNQLTDSSVYESLESKGMLYCPDFVVNAGGVISCAGETCVDGGWSEAWVLERVNNIYNNVAKVLDESKKRGRFTEVVAVELAKERVERERQKKATS